MYGKDSEYVPDVDIVWIHWPEAMFNWSAVSEEQIERFEQSMKTWKVNSKLVYTRHNFLPHRLRTPGYVRLYEIILREADCVVHLGQESFNELAGKGSGKTRHVIIPHHVYTLYPNDVSRAEARSYLKINSQRQVLLVFGAVRHKAEKKFIHQVFKLVHHPDRLLLVPRMEYFFPAWLRFLLTKKARKILSETLNSLLSFRSKYVFGNRFIQDGFVQHYFKAADVLLIPRQDTLNSGLAFLGMAYDLPVVGPETGNIGEVLRASGNFVYDNGTAEQAAECINNIFQGKSGYHLNPVYLDNINPRFAAAQYDALFNQLILD
jgi:glycosyltransferase involved in cell wall biosynthesis